MTNQTQTQIAESGSALGAGTREFRPQDVDPAFPLDGHEVMGAEGATMWDYFAAAALAGVCAHGALMPNEHREIAAQAARIADEMYAERLRRAVQPRPLSSSDTRK